MTPGLTLRDFMGMTKRNLLRIIRTPQLLVDVDRAAGDHSPAVPLRARGAIHIPGIDYVDYVVPAIFLEAVLIGGMTTVAGPGPGPPGGHDRPLPQPAHGPIGLPGGPHAGRPLPQRPGALSSSSASDCWSDSASTTPWAHAWQESG